MENIGNVLSIFTINETTNRWRKKTMHRTSHGGLLLSCICVTVSLVSWWKRRWKLFNHLGSSQNQKLLHNGILFNHQPPKKKIKLKKIKEKGKSSHFGFPASTPYIHIKSANIKALTATWHCTHESLIDHQHTTITSLFPIPFWLLHYYHLSFSTYMRKWMVNGPPLTF